MFALFDLDEAGLCCRANHRWSVEHCPVAAQQTITQDRYQPGFKAAWSGGNVLNSINFKYVEPVDLVVMGWPCKEDSVNATGSRS